MLSYIKKILFSPENETVNEAERLQVATCALFIEMVKSDSEFTEEEKNKIIELMKERFPLNDEEVNELIELAEQEISTSISYYDFTSQLNNRLNKNEKYELVKNLWRLIYTDNKLDKYEDQLVKRLGGMFNLDFPDIIAAKLEVKKEVSNN